MSSIKGKEVKNRSNGTDLLSLDSTPIMPRKGGERHE